MKKIMLFATLLGLVIVNTVCAQTQKVNEECSVSPCESGLYCVETRDGKKKCATCEQSTLNDLTDNVDKCCKTSGQGWTPETSQDYKDAMAADGRVLVDVFDKMLENAKKCREARESREDKCWKGGDADHQAAINQVKESIDRISTHKYRMISEKKVYYGSKSYYDSRLSTFQSKSNLDFPDIDSKLSAIEKDINDGKKVSCPDIEKYSNDLERCVDAAKDLLYDGFQNSTDKFPGEYNDIYTKSQDMLKRAKGLLDAAKSKDLCN
jgi:hypothetical protein